MASDEQQTGDAPSTRDPHPASGPLPDTPPEPSDPQTSIIRRHPTGEIPIGPDQPATQRADQYDPQTSIIRRHPTGAIPIASDETQAVSQADPETWGHRPPEGQGDYIPRARPTAVSPTRAASPSPRSAVAAAVFSILTGWPTAVIATNLIANWWRTDQLFCVAVGFLTAISAAALIAGLIGLLLRRWVSRLLIMVGAVVALLIFSSLFVAGAKLPPIVYAIPVLPVLAIVAAALPATGRWERSG